MGKTGSLLLATNTVPLHGPFLCCCCCFHGWRRERLKGMLWLTENKIIPRFKYILQFVCVQTHTHIQSSKCSKGGNVNTTSLRSIYSNSSVSNTKPLLLSEEWQMVLLELLRDKEVDFLTGRRIRWSIDYNPDGFVGWEMTDKKRRTQAASEERHQKNAVGIYSCYAKLLVSGFRIERQEFQEPGRGRASSSEVPSPLHLRTCFPACNEWARPGKAWEAGRRLGLQRLPWVSSHRGRQGHRGLPFDCSL